MSVAKTIEISAESPDGFEDAIRRGVAKARETVHSIRTAWVKEQKVTVAEDGSVVLFRVHMQITFELD